LRDGNLRFSLGISSPSKVYSEVEPFEGWKPDFKLIKIALRVFVYSEVEPFEGWKLIVHMMVVVPIHSSIARLNPLRDGNLASASNTAKTNAVYSEVEPFEGWKQIKNFY